MKEAELVNTGWPSKADWGPGPWQDEPDRLEWRHKGVPCLLARGPVGAWCGYAAVPPGHPWHGRSFQTLGDVQPHRGLSYGEPCQGVICHVPAPGEPDNVWWLGFDCAHVLYDVAPAMEAMTRELCNRLRMNRGPSPFGEAVYRTMEYAKAETEKLVEQILEAAHG